MNGRFGEVASTVPGSRISDGPSDILRILYIVAHCPLSTSTLVHRAKHSLYYVAHWPRDAIAPVILSVLLITYGIRNMRLH